MMFRVATNESPSIEVTGRKTHFRFREPAPRENSGPGRRLTMKLTIRKNETFNHLAKKITANSALWALGGALILAVMVPSSFAANKSAEQCSLAIVTKQAVGSAQVCDPKTVRNLARNGHVFEQNQLGIVSMLAIGPEYSPEQALQWFERAARNGYAPAQVNLGIMYANGWGTSPNLGAALRWFKEASDHGYARADYNLGLLYMQGRGVPKDYAQARRYFEKGAEGGDSAAQTNLGYLYSEGLGMARDPKTAADWYRKAAEAGNALGENNLADLYLRGEGIAQNDAEAFRLFQQAAQQGHTGARIKLAYMYSTGRGAEKNLETACAWVTAATVAGDDRGRDLLHSIETQLTESQLAGAREKARKLNAESESQLSAKALLP
jgi:TPR repeat protein